MDQLQKGKRFGICVLLWAALLRMTVSIDATSVRFSAAVSRMAPFLIYLETGRTVRFSPSSEEITDYFRESPAPVREEAPLPSFTAEDLSLVELYNTSSRNPDPEALLRAALDWELAADEPRVLIVHTHTTESYTKTEEPYTEVSDYRTLDEAYNMLSIGDRVAELLEGQGIRVIHDRTVHDYPSYNGSYVHTRNTIETILAEHPEVCLVLDLHRDASGSPGRQLRTRARVDGTASAQLMLVVGTNYDGWQQNLALALKLQVTLERRHRGIMRPLSLRAQRFNQDLSPGALLVEVGAAGNTHAEALVAAQALAEAVVELARGSAAAE